MDSRFAKETVLVEGIELDGREGVMSTFVIYRAADLDVHQANM